MKLFDLRQKHPVFAFDRYSIKPVGGDLVFQFFFSLASNISFSPQVTIKNIPLDSLKRIPPEVLDNFAFHLGLAETPSYWKATCSPQIIIKAGALSQEQTRWWHDLVLNGLGEFFYTNQIDFTSPNFVAWKVEAPKNPPPIFSQPRTDRTLVPIGGGKDSVVTWETLNTAGKDITAFSLNPTSSTRAIFKVAGIARPIIVERTIDPKLLELNSQGYLNGHTPFSSYLAFLTTICAALFDFRFIAVSNESSANEANLAYLKTQINHQYSKTYQFESSFRDYAHKYLTDSVNYFSFLRPLYELQITRLFSRYPNYFSAFRSCNSTQISGWCGLCPKCLFVFTALFPFVAEDKLISIFGHNLFEDKSLLPLAYELTGSTHHKPLECIGTIKENKIAFYLSISRYQKQSKSLPPLLQSIHTQVLSQEKDLRVRSQNLLSSWDKHNFLPSPFATILKTALNHDLS